MRKIGLFLLAVVMMVGVAGCSGDDFSPTVSNMAGIYNLTKVTSTEGGVTVTFVSPDVTGTANLTTAGTYTVDITLEGDRQTGGGTFAISGDTIVLDGGDASGPITDDGRKFSVSSVDGGQTLTFDFTKS